MPKYDDIEELSWESEPKNDNELLSDKFTKEALNHFLKILIQKDPKNKDAYSIAPTGVIKVDLKKIQSIHIVENTIENRIAYVKDVSNGIFYQSPGISMYAPLPESFLRSFGLYSQVAPAPAPGAGAGAGAEHKAQP